MFSTFEGLIKKPFGGIIFMQNQELNVIALKKAQFCPFMVIIGIWAALYSMRVIWIFLLIPCMLRQEEARLIIF